MIAGARRYALALLEQGLTALLSLAVALWLIRRGTEDAFAAWVFWANAVLVLCAVLTAMTTVHLHRLPSGPAGRRGTERAVLSAALGLGAVLTVLTAVAVLLLPEPLSVAAAVLFVPGTLVGFHARVLAASRGALGSAAAISAAVFVTVLSGLAVGEALGFPVTAGKVMLLHGIGQALAGGAVLVRLHAGAPPDFGVSGQRRWRVLLRRSPWPVSGAIAAETSTRLYVFLVPAMVGTATLGQVAAAQTFLRPATLLAGAWSAAARAPLAAARGRGDRLAFLRIIALGAFVPAAAVLALGLVVAAGWPLISQYLYGGRFPGLEGTVLLWTANMAVSCFVLAGTVAAHALGRLRALARSEIAGAALCAAAMPVLLSALPAEAALAAMILGGVVQVLIQWRLLRGSAPGRA